MPAAEERAKILFSEVETTVKNGGTIRLGQHDTARRVARYLDTQKRYIAVNVTSFAITAMVAVLGGPIGAAVTLGGAIVGWGLGMAWERLTVWWSKGKYQKKKDAGLTVTKKEEMRLASGKKVEVTGVLNEDYAEVLDDVKTVLKGKGLTDVYNALANLDNDFQNLRKFMTLDPAISGEWTKGTFGATRAHNQGPSLPVQLASCNDAVELWETVLRINKRYGEVAEVHAMLDEFILYIALTVSQYDATERADMRNAWQMIASGRKVPEILSLFNEAVNREGLQKHWGRSVFGRTKDYSGWIYSMIPDYIKASWHPTFKMDMELEVLRRTDAGAFKTAKDGICSAMSGLFDVGKDYVTGTIPIPDSASWEDLGGSVKSGTITVGGAFLTTWFNSMKSQAWQVKYAGADPTDPSSFASLSSTADAQKTALSVLDPLNPSKFASAVETHVMGIATSLVKVAVDAANDKWNERKLETGQTLGATGMRQQSFGERIGTLRTFAKKDIDDYVDVLKEWEEAHSNLSGSLNLSTLPGAFLAHVKCSQAYYGNKTGQFFEELVFMANEMATKTRIAITEAEAAIQQFVARTDHRTTCKGKTYCYGSLVDYFAAWVEHSKAPWALEDPSLMPTLRGSYDHVPARMVAGNALEIFMDELQSQLPSEARYMMSEEYY